MCGGLWKWNPFKIRAVNKALRPDLFCIWYFDFPDAAA